MSFKDMTPPEAHGADCTCEACTALRAAGWEKRSALSASTPQDCPCRQWRCLPLQEETGTRGLSDETVKRAALAYEIGGACGPSKKCGHDCATAHEHRMRLALAAASLPSGDGGRGGFPWPSKRQREDAANSVQYEFAIRALEAAAWAKDLGLDAPTRPHEPSPDDLVCAVLWSLRGQRDPAAVADALKRAAGETGDGRELREFTIYVCPNCGRIEPTLCTACVEPERLPDGATTPRWYRTVPVRVREIPSEGARA